MGINLHNGFWCCWRDQRAHSGRRPHRLVMALLGCSYERAIALIGESAPVGEIDGALRQLGVISRQHRTRQRSGLTMPKEFHLIDDSRLMLPFRHYLSGRQFRDRDLMRLANRYRLRGCFWGEFAYRLIVPVYMADEQLVTWTGRAIGRSRFRYRSLSHNEQGQYPKAVTNIKDTLAFYDQLVRDQADCLLVHEGPFDALKVDFYGDGVRATCTWSVNISEAQIELLAALRRNYRRIVFVYDRDALSKAIAAVAAVPELQCEFYALTKTKDPGALSVRGVRHLVERVV
jgi:hypothetical protein